MLLWPSYQLELLIAGRGSGPLCRTPRLLPGLQGHCALMSSPTSSLITFSAVPGGSVYPVLPFLLHHAPGNDSLPFPPSLVKSSSRKHLPSFLRGRAVCGVLLTSDRGTQPHAPLKHGATAQGLHARQSAKDFTWVVSFTLPSNLLK